MSVAGREYQYRQHPVIADQDANPVLLKNVTRPHNSATILQKSAKSSLIYRSRILSGLGAFFGIAFPFGECC